MCSPLYFYFQNLISFFDRRDTHIKYTEDNTGKRSGHQKFEPDSFPPGRKDYYLQNITCLMPLAVDACIFCFKCVSSWIEVGERYFSFFTQIDPLVMKTFQFVR